MAEEYDLQGNPITSGNDGGASGDQQGVQEFDLQGSPVGSQERQPRQRQPQRQQPRQGREVEGGYTVGGNPFAGQQGVTQPSEQPVTPQRGGEASAGRRGPRAPSDSDQGSAWTDPIYSFGQGLARSGTRTMQGLGIAQGAVTGQDPRDTWLHSTGTDLQESAKQALPTRPTEEDERRYWSQELPSAVGEFTGMIGAALLPVPGARVGSAVGRGAQAVGAGAKMAGMAARGGAAATRSATPASMGTAQMAQEGFQDALREGADLETAMATSGLTAALGPAETIPVLNILRRADKATGGRIRRIIKEAGFTGTEEAAQEAGTTIAQNLIASDVVKYDPDRQMFRGATEAGEIGFGAGALMGTVFGMVGGRRMSQESGIPLKDDEEKGGGPRQPDQYEQTPTMDVGGDLEGALGQSMQGRQAEAQQPAAASRGGPTAAEAGATLGVAPASPAGTGTPDDPLRPMTDEAIKQYEQRINQLPTDGQAEAGNYAKLHGSFQGLDIAIENARGQKRRGTDPSGRQWETELPANYGYIKGTKGPDGDAVDTFVGPNASMDRAYVIDQRDPDSRQFDEPKVMLGFDSQQEAVDTYKRAFDDRADERIQSVTPTSISGVRNVLDQNDRTVNEPFSDLFESTPISDAEIAETAQRRNLTGDLESAITDEVSFEEAQQQVPEAFNAIEQEVLEQGRPQQAEQAKRRTYELARDNQLSAAMEARRGRGDQGVTGGGAAAAGVGGRGAQQTELEQPDAGAVERTPTPEQTLELSQRNMARQQGRDIQQFDPDQYLQGQQAAQQRQGLPTRTDYGDRLQDANMQVPQRSPDQVDPQAPYSTLRFDDQGVQEQSFATAGEAVQAAARLPRDAEFQVRNMATGEVVAEPSLQQNTKMKVYQPSLEGAQDGGQQVDRGREGDERGRETSDDTGGPSSGSADVQQSGRRYRDTPRQRGDPARIDGADVQRVFRFDDGRNIYEVSESADAWTQRVERAKEQLGPVGAQVSSEAGDRLFLFDDGNSGFALDGDSLVSVFSTPNSPRGVIERIMDVAPDQGAQRLDAFNTFLPRAYAKYGGFRTVARLGFDPDYAPEGWDYDYYQQKYGTGQPDVAFMVHDPANARAEGGQRVDDYDEGVRLQREALQQRGAQYSATPSGGTRGTQEEPQRGARAEDGEASAGGRGRTDVADLLQGDGNPDEQGRLTEPPVNEDGTVTLHHWSTQEGLEQLDPSQHGTGIAGQETRRKRNYGDAWVDRTYFGIAVDQPGGYTKERGLGDAKYTARVPAGRLYPLLPKLLGGRGDPDGLIAQAKQAFPNDSQGLITEYERLIKEAGYAGYWTDAGGEMGLTAAVFEPTSVQRDTEAGSDVMYSVTALRRGTEMLEEYGLERPENKPAKVQQIVKALNRRQREKFGQIALDDYSEAAQEQAANWLAEEVQFEARMPAARSGFGWHTKKYKQALRSVGDLFPEFQSQEAVAGTAFRNTKEARDYFTAILAITSNGANARDNFRAAAHFYNTARQDGFIRMNRGVRRGATGQHLQTLNDLVEQHGIRGARDRMLAETTVREINQKYRAETGKPAIVNYPDDMTVPQAAGYFGPKLGAFYANLMGKDGYLTMDLWWTRTINRYRGQLETRASDQGVDRVARLVAKEEQLNVAPEDMSRDDVIAKAVPYAQAYAKRGFKRGTELEKAANTLVKDEFGTREQPMGANDRRFMVAVASRARQLLSDQGLDASISDIQAAAWFFEKRLYRDVGGRERGDISYAEAARELAAEWATRDDIGAEGAVESDVQERDVFWSATPASDGGRLSEGRGRDGGAVPEQTAREQQAEDQGRANVGGDFGSGLGYRDFFAQAAAGQHAPAKLDQKGYDRLIDLSSIDSFVQEYQRHRGNFDDHIMTSIPAFGDIQPNVGNAIFQTLNETGGNVLDIGASEAAMIKAISAQSNGRIKTVAVDPNPQMAREQAEISKVRGMTYRQDAFGTAEQAGQVAWTEDDGTQIRYYDPGDTRFDVVHEAMVFQFISNERESQLRRAKEVMKDDGMLIVEEKHVPDEGQNEVWERNEKKKDSFKEQYYTDDQLQKKKQQVLEGDTEAKTRDQIAREEEGVMGMHDLMVSSAEMERILSGEFRHVVQFWDSGNFKGYVATNDRAKLDQFLGNLLDTNTDYSTVETPRTVQEVEGPAFTPTSAFEKRRLKSRQRIQEIADRITGGRAQIDFKPKIIAQNGSVRDSGGEVGGAVGGYVIPDQWLIGLAMEDSRFDPRNEVGHEAFHLLEHYGLFTPEEMSALQRNEPFLREEAAKEFRLPANSKLIKELASHEVRAIAFARYRRLKEEGQPRAGYLPAIRRAFNKVLEFMQQVRNAMRGLGFRTVNSVFEDVRTGVLARRGSVDIESSFTGPELYSDRGTAPAFFSKLRVGMENVDADAMKGNGWLQQIDKLKKQGVKDEELEWSGLPEWLEENKGTKLSKQQVLDFIDANTIEIGEVQYIDQYDGPDPDEEYEPDIIRQGEYTEEPVDEDGEPLAPVKVHELEDRETGETYTVQVDEDAGNVTAMRADGTPVPVPGEMNRQDIQDGTDAVVTDLTAQHGRWPDNLGALVEQAENAGIWKSKQVARQASQIARSISVQNDPNSGDVDRLIAMFRGNTDDRAWVERLYEMQEAAEQQQAEVLQGRPEYGRYATPGGENYREVLLTVPQLGDTYRSDHWKVDNVLAHVRMQDFENADGEQVLLVDEIQSDWHQQGREKGYKPSGQELQRQRVEAEAQYEEGLTENLRRIEESENGTAWVQWIKDMVYKMPPEAAQTLGDPDTRTGLAQAAAEVYMNTSTFGARQSSPMRRGELNQPPGYNAVETPGYEGSRRAEWASEALRRVVGRETVNATQEARDNMERLQSGRPPGTPQAPFKRTWPELALKRVLREAAEQGYDRVAWTTGATQADRYNLRRHLQNIHLTPRPSEGEGMMRLEARDKSGAMVLDRMITSQDQAADYLGQEPAQRLFSGENAERMEQGMPASLQGEQLETGGEGMKAFYDKMLPNFAKKYVKKWGAKVEPSTIQLPQPPADQLSGLGQEMAAEAGTQTMQVWSVPITTDMREAVLNQGQPLYSATKTIKEDAPVSRSVADRVIGEPGTNPLLQSMKEVFRSDATWPGKFRMAFNHLRERFRLNSLQGSFDQYYALYDREMRSRGQVDFKRSGWVAALMTNDIGSVMANVIGEKYGGEWQGGALKYDRKEGAFTLDTDAKPMFAILEPLARAGRLKQWQLWTVAKRTKRIIQEDAAYNAANPDKKPRDRDALMAEIARQEGKDRMQLIDEIIAEGNKHPEFQQALDEWNDLNSRILDMAQDAGIVNKEQREVWEQQDYVPFYRVVQELGDDTITGPSQRAGIVNQDAQIRALRGGEAPVNDIVENMALNLTHLVQSSMKNVAAQKAVPVLTATGDIEKVPYKAQPQHVSNAEAKKALQNAGVDVGEMTEEQMQRYFSVFQMVPPRGRDVFHVMVDGKPQFYRVNDPLLFSALTSMGVDRPQGWMRVLSAPKKLLTEFVTADPAFAIANGMRDSIQTWLITGEKFTPIYDSVKGMNRAWKRDASMRAIMAGGGGGGGFYSFASQDVRKQIEQHDPRSVVDSPSKAITLMKRLYRGYDRLLNTTEMANRISVYDQVKARGGSEAEAIFQAKDVMNFTMRGDWSIVRALVHMVPFMNARLQGLYRLGRGAKDNPRKFFLRGSLLTGVTMALWALNYDDERYQDLPEFEKDTYYHLFMDNIFGKEAVDAMGLPDWMRHIRIPKPFEVGAIFSTMPERAANTMLGTDTGEIFAERMRHMMMSTFSLNPIPQAALPIIEQWANKSFFMDTHIVSPYSQDLPPEMQYEADTSETARAVGEAISFSPQRVEHLVRGYLGSVGMYMLDASDMAMRGVGAYEEAPVTRPDEMPVISRFFRGEPKKYTKWLGEFYDTKREIDGIYNGIQQARERRNYDAARRLRQENAELLRMRGQFQSIQQQLRRINEQMRRVHWSGMSPEDKRERLDNLYERRNRTVARIERMLRDVVVEDGEVRSVGGEDDGGPAGWLNVISDAFAKGETDRAQMAYDRAETQGVQIDVSEAARRSGQDATARILENAPAGMAQRIEQNQEQ